MNPQLLASAVNNVTYYVRYGHGDIEQALDAIAIKPPSIYIAPSFTEREFYAGTPEDRAEVKAAAMAKLGDERQVHMTPEIKAAQAAAEEAEKARKAAQDKIQREADREFNAKYGDAIRRELELMREMDDPNSDL